MNKLSRLAFVILLSSTSGCSAEPDAPVADAAASDATSHDAGLRDATNGSSDTSAMDGRSGDEATSLDDASVPDASDVGDGTIADVPDASDTAPDVSDSAIGDGACLLKYNSDIHFEGGATGTTGTECCYAAGSSNACDLTGRCGAVSGGGCCILYSTPADPFPTACCFYEKGLKAPGDPRCNGMVDAGH
jgi:hypothetical protein